MTDHQYAYPFDPTGELNDNLIVKESHIISAPDYTDFYFVVPSAGPFFEHNLKVQHWPSGRILVNGVDFILSYKFLSASRATAKPVYGAISILDRVLSGVLEVTYQTLGGPWTINEAQAAEMLSNATSNPRRTTWEQVVELPHAFPVIDHEWDLVDMVGGSELRDALDRITGALYDQVGAGGTGDAHATNRDNPHQVTKAQVGLGSVDNFATASFTEGTDPLVTNRFMTPQRVAQLIDGYIAGRVDSHIANVENPHNVTQTQVGLSNVPNFRVADSIEAVDPLVANRFVTPQRVHEAIQFVAIAALDTHKADIQNPHGVTKSQVGLDRVENYSIASDTVARDGTSQIHYLTPHGAQQLINAKVGAGVGDHVANVSNPHSVTKGQVGLGNVPNFAMTTAASAVVGTAQNEFMSPYHSRLLIESLIGDANVALNTTINDHTSDFTNPHQVTATQVGLGSVQNYGISTTLDAISGLRNDVYMTPYVTDALVGDRITTAFTGFVAEDSSRLEGQTLIQVSDLIVGRVTPAITAVETDVTALSQTVTTNRGVLDGHVADIANPHNVNKAQVGLSNVDNFAMASLLEAAAGTAIDRFMSPALVAESISAQALAPLNTHIADTTNPHGVTKSQVGLDQVDNFGTASTAEASSGTAIDKFMTPATTAAAISAQATANLTTHIEDVTNPHSVTKDQVGLGSVENYSIASATAILGDEYGYIATAGQLVFSGADTLGKVLNFVPGARLIVSVNGELVAFNSDAATNTVSLSTAAAIDDIVEITVYDNNAYMTPARVSSAIQNQVGNDLETHVDNLSNPHQVTKTQVGLSNVDNYATASVVDAEAGVSASLFMTPQATSAAIAVQVTANLDTHVADTTNPHQVTKAQVGLGGVDNYATASVLEAEAGLASNKFMTPALVSSAIASQVTGDLNAHVGDLTNPHQVTQTQVGLGNVANFSMATNTQARQELFTEAYMSPATTHLIIGEAIAAFNTDVLTPQITTVNGRVDGVVTNLQTHEGLTTNPHQVTKTQVGLGSVANYPIATAAQALDAVNSSSYMTPQRVIESISNYVDATLTDLNQGLQATGGQLSTHLVDVANPHSVTKAQVGLNNVANFSVATSIEAVDALIDNRYMTPATTADAITASQQSVNDQINTLINTTDTLIETTPRTSYYPENPDAVVKYQKVAEAVIDNVTMDALLTTPFTMFSAEYRVSHGVNDLAAIQSLMVRINPTTGALAVSEVSLLDEVESMFIAKLERGTTNTVFTVWRRIEANSAAGMLIVTDRYGTVELTPTALMSTTAPTGGSMAEPFSVGFAYRLAETIEIEFKLLAQDLATI